MREHLLPVVPGSLLQFLVVFQFFIEDSSHYPVAFFELSCELFVDFGDDFFERAQGFFLFDWPLGSCRAILPLFFLDQLNSSFEGFLQVIVFQADAIIQVKGCGRVPGQDLGQI